MSYHWKRRNCTETTTTLTDLLLLLISLKQMYDPKRRYKYQIKLRVKIIWKFLSKFTHFNNIFCIWTACPYLSRISSKHFLNIKLDYLTNVLKFDASTIFRGKVVQKRWKTNAKLRKKLIETNFTNTNEQLLNQSLTIIAILEVIFSYDQWFSILFPVYIRWSIS